MQRTLRSLASRYAGAISSAQQGVSDAAAASTTTSAFSGLISHGSTHPLPLRGAASSTSLAGGVGSGGALPTGAPRSCLWLLALAPSRTSLAATSASAPSSSCSPSGACSSQPSTSRPSCSPLLPASAAALRHYAKAAKGGGGAAPAAAAGPKRPRTSTTKLYSCRNDRLRHTHEQIWPTLQLTEYEQAMFKRNSRQFVVDMGRSLSLRDKFRMGAYEPATAASTGEAAAADEEAGGGAGAGDALVPAAGGASYRRVPYWQARSLLHESNLHLDALGENPRYLRLRRVGSLFATKLQNVRKLRLLLGFERRGFVQRLYEHSLLARGPDRMWKMVCAMEATLPMTVTRMGLAEDVVAATTAIRNDKIYVNGKQPAMPRKGLLQPGDVVGPAAGGAAYLRKRVARSLAPLANEVAFDYV
ncbi:hypothetical protein HYH02_014311 [Chlamydomonas schloesseri]|uniref:Uncharacterized protein n=1 Tax=Chlamydomonas schloesseri TaxID=2026947 RepID=A0A835SXG8_9CHLO|nr:hypothetical protein HYH02_014311 [Chlamydomonas schloesseri]|eukprot:KAG2428610.1 hypothetical protein HYH02_014311 [Chlamydomonas schloesseri]